MTNQNLSSNDTPQQIVDNLQQLSEEAIQEEQQAQQQSQSADWSSGIDVIEIGSSVLNGLGDLLSGIDISF